MTWSERDFFDKRVRTKPFDPPPKPSVRVMWKISRKYKALTFWAHGPCSHDYRPRNWSRNREKAATYPSYCAYKMRETTREDFGAGCGVQLHPVEYPND